MKKEIINYLKTFFDENDKLYDDVIYYVENNNMFLNNPALKRYKNINLTKENVDDFSNNPFIKNIKLQNIKEKNISISNEVIKKNQIFLNNIYTVNKIDEIINLGYFDKDVTFPVIFQDDLSWMSVVPSEINTMKSDIEKMHGDVLVLGCGIGYIEYLLSLKENVSTITIIELNNDILNIFTKYILPQFNTNKIKVINKDALVYLKTTDLSIYDFIYSDIWYNGLDGLELYLKILPYEFKYKDTTFLYWIEDEIIEQIRLGIYCDIINEELSQEEINFLKNINTIEDLSNRFTKNNIKNIYLPSCNFIL